jgi:hypothetical protein
MKSHLNHLAPRILSSLVCGALVACGGGSPDSQSGSGSQQLALTTSVGTSTTTAATTTPTTSTPATTAATTSTTTNTAATGTAITDVRIENTDPVNAQTKVPVTFGQVFAVGDLLPGQALVGRFEDGTTTQLQVDVKATHPDGSVRHAIISGLVPTLAAGATRTLSLVKTTSSLSISPASISALLAAGFNSSVKATIGGVEYTASADALLKNASAVKWISGPIANEWEVTAPLTTAAGAAHPHLSARFAIRYYEAARKARVDVTIENDWAYEPNPQNFTYDAQVLVGGKPVYAKSALNHLHHSRWRKLFWWNGTEPAINVRHNTRYLIATRALPNYDQSITVPEASLAALKSRWTGAITEPMAVGLANPYMPSTGGRDDIGLLPGWAASYLLSMDKRAKDVTLGTADLAGSWSSHYRDKNTGRPISLLSYPYMTMLGHPGDTYNPVTKKTEAFPACASGASCATPNTHDVPHQPNLVYLPYLVTGDHYYLEELQFWAMYDVFSSNPGYRENVKGLLSPEQVRGQAWGLRTLSEAAYVTPDADPLKADFNAVLESNLDWYNASYTNNPAANKLGVIINGYSIVYNNSTGLAPWQDDFFTSAVGHAAELGFAKAKSLLSWKIKFPVDRMVAPGVCWIDGAIYTLTVRDSETSPIYSTMAEAYKASHAADFTSLACNSSAMATSLGLKVGQMTGYADGNQGYPSNMQPALAYGADVGGVSGKSAWDLFMSRAVKPDYSSAPEFAIVPR